ncbi:Hypothetical protein, putative [Bodo saltans]|uniref:Uncharacterized protein n=1 Tax=Bodo saltans TaxID=75058 RepID=A0A0S4JC09_BODSA|nr:Hypothetical protein, putative [Bodo saltans]|eukprot:CUG87707.1 Hypothetical protein, putative [Bodo saltans]
MRTNRIRERKVTCHVAGKFGRWHPEGQTLGRKLAWLPQQDPLVDDNGRVVERVMLPESIMHAQFGWVVPYFFALMALTQRIYDVGDAPKEAKSVEQSMRTTCLLQRLRWAFWWLGW